MAAMTVDAFSAKLEEQHKKLLDSLKNEVTHRIDNIEENVRELQLEVKENSSLANFADHAIYAESRSFEKNVLILGIRKTDLRGEQLKKHDNELAFKLIRSVVKDQNFGWKLTGFHVENVVRLITRPYTGDPKFRPKYAGFDKIRVVMLSAECAITVLKCAKLYNENSENETKIEMSREISQAKRVYVDFCHHQKDQLNADPAGTNWHSVVDDYVRPGRKRNPDEQPKQPQRFRVRRGGRGGGRRGRFFNGLGRNFFPHNYEFGGNGDEGTGGSGSSGSTGQETGGASGGPTDGIMQFENTTYRSKFANQFANNAAKKRGNKKKPQYFGTTPNSRPAVSVHDRINHFEGHDTQEVGTHEERDQQPTKNNKRTAQDMSPDNNSGFNQGSSKTKVISPKRKNQLSSTVDLSRSQDGSKSLMSTPAPNDNVKIFEEIVDSDSEEENNEENENNSSTDTDDTIVSTLPKNFVHQNETTPEIQSENYALCPPTQFQIPNSDGEDEVEFFKNGRPIKSVLGDGKIMPNEMFDLWMEKYYMLKQKQATCKQEMFVQLIDDCELLHFLCYHYEDSKYHTDLVEWCRISLKLIEPIFNISTINTKGYTFDQLSGTCSAILEGKKKPIVYTTLLTGSFISRERNYIMSRTKSAKRKQELRESMNKNLDSSILLKDGNLMFSPAKI